MKRSSVSGFVCGVLLAMAPSSAFAAEGAIEINQTCAVQTGCLPGDTAGFPVTLGTAGSYLLTGDLSVGDANTTAIDVSANEVLIDLNGHAIRGVTSCTSSPVSACSPTGTGQGIGGFSARTTVRNGVIVGMGSTGLSIGADGIVEGIHANGNGGYGISTGGNGIVTLSSGSRNLNAGIKLNNGIARANTAKENGAEGVSMLGSASVVESNQVYTNAGNGISCGGACNIHHNTVSLNFLNGIYCLPSGNVTSGFEIHHNAVSRNGIDGINCLVPHNSIMYNTAVSNLGDGLDALESLFLGNVASANGGFGLRTTLTGEGLFTDAFGQNLLIKNTLGDVDGGPHPVDCNRIGLTTSCPP